MNNYSLSSGTHDWLEALRSAVSTGEQSVLVTILAVKGSAPREPGTKMLVQSTVCTGTIGGGHLEAKIIQKAREILVLGTPNYERLRVPLGASLGQCCGGHVELILEIISVSNAAWVSDLYQLIKQDLPCVLTTSLQIRHASTAASDSQNAKLSTKAVITTSTEPHLAASTEANKIDIRFAQSMLKAGASSNPVIKEQVLYEPLNKKLFRLYVFGAGHVGKAVIQALQPLPCDIVWIDNRAEMFANFPEFKNVRIELTDDPLALVSKIIPNSFVVVMTHNHQLDFSITEHVLTQTAASYVGLIGSDTKSRRFKQRLQAKGASTAVINKLTCPIGIDGVTGKHPAQIALSLSAQLLKCAETKLPALKT